MGLLKRLMEMEKRYTIRSVLKEKYGIDADGDIISDDGDKVVIRIREHENGRIVDSEEIFR